VLAVVERPLHEAGEGHRPVAADLPGDAFS
jgi:hypothetical protein